MIFKTLANKTSSSKPKGLIFTLLPLGNSFFKRLIALSSSLSSTSTQNNRTESVLFLFEEFLQNRLERDERIKGEKLKICLKSFSI